MTLRSYKQLAIKAAFGLSTLIMSGSVMAASDTSGELPILHYAGVLPVQWEKDDSWNDLATVKKSISKDFSDAIRESHRFVMLNDDLVGSLWSTPAGRKELASDYELQTFAALNMSSRGDMVVMTARLLSPTFDSWLQESEVVARNWLAESSREQIVAKLSDLIHRMINRLPIDAHVTSVSGEFVTISAGMEQSVSVGDDFDVISPKIQTLHPANGSWLSFTIARSGKVKVVEAKGKSSIAKITSLTHEGSIVVGQGIRIEAISGRNRFARPDGSETFIEEQSKDGNALVPAMKPDGEPVAPKRDVPVSPAKAPRKPEPAKAAEETATEAGPAKSDEPPKEEAAEEAKEEEKDDGPGILEKIAPPGAELDAYAGLRSWGIGGSGTASATLPLWLVNSIGATVKRSLSEAIVINYGLDLGYGNTSKGSFFGYGLHGSGLYIHKKKLFDGADKIFGGLEARIHSISVGGETSGGFDLTTLNLIAGMGGLTKSSLLGSKVDWTADLRFALQESGRFGVNGSMKSVKGGRGMLLSLLGYLGDRPKTGNQFGGGFEFGSGNYNLSDSRSATYNVISLLGLMRCNL